MSDFIKKYGWIIGSFISGIIVETWIKKRQQEERSKQLRDTIISTRKIVNNKLGLS